MTAQCDLRKIFRAAQARQDGGALKVSAALKASTACWGVGRNKKDDHPCITHQNENDCLDSFYHLWPDSVEYPL